MTSIKIVLSEDRKKRIKKASVDAGKTLSRYVLDMVDPLNEDTVRNELTALEEQLNRFGGRMSYEERTALKIRRIAAYIGQPRACGNHSRPRRPCGRLRPHHPDIGCSG